jgi:DNA-binding transcriptional MocR family regulator
MMKAARRIGVSAHSLFELIMWSFRNHGQGLVRKSISEMVRLSGMCRQTIVTAIKQLEDAGLLRKVKRRIFVRWALGIASRQDVNIYELLVPVTESNRQTVVGENIELESLEQMRLRRGDDMGGDVDKSPLDLALEKLGESIKRRLPVAPRRWDWVQRG